MIRASLLALAMTATPALAEFMIKEGSFFIVHRDYDHETNTYSDGAPQGEEEACFQITDVNLDKEMIDFTLISGHYAPWWMDGEVLEPGFDDTYVPAIGFTKNNPSALWTDLLQNILKTVPSCPAPSS